MSIDDEPDPDAASEPVLVATFPSAPAPPPSVAVTRIAPSAPIAPAALGAFRTAGLPFVERRDAGSLVIASRWSRVTYMLLASTAVAAIVLSTRYGGLVMAALIAAVSVVGGFVLRETGALGGLRIELTARRLVARPSATDRPRAIARAAIRRLHCAEDLPLPTNQYRDQYRVMVGRRWGVYVVDADDDRTRIADVGNRTDATAIAALLTHELGLPTWLAPADGDDG